VREAVVLAQDSGHGQQLVAYVVAEEQAWRWTPPNCATACANSSAGQPADHGADAHPAGAGLPLTANGKLDRKALPSPDNSALQHAYRAPQTPLDSTLRASGRGARP
jgi:acyl-coenzyme A synthetase/AMP-(fatty) acid ligase